MLEHLVMLQIMVTLQIVILEIVTLQIVTLQTMVTLQQG